MKTSWGFIIGCALVIAGCGGSEPPNRPLQAEPAPRPTSFDPLVRTLDRAEGVLQTADERAAELRRRMEEAEQ